MRSDASLDIYHGKNCLTKIWQFLNINPPASQRRTKMILTPLADTIKRTLYPNPRLPHIQTDVLVGLGLLSCLSNEMRAIIHARSHAAHRHAPHSYFLGSKPVAVAACLCARRTLSLACYLSVTICQATVIQMCQGLRRRPNRRRPPGKSQPASAGSLPLNLHMW